MRRMVLFVTLCVALVLSAAHPQGQPRPTLSDDLKAALASGARVRVIVQAEEGALTTLRFRLGRGLRRQLAGALSLDVSGSELGRLVADGGVAHISKDLPVVADMAITNQVTRADKVWAGHARTPRTPVAAGSLGHRHRRRRHRFGHRRSRGARRVASSRGSTSSRTSPASRAIRSDTAHTSRASSAAARPRPRA